VIVQFFLSQEVTGKDTALQRLNAQLAQLTEMLSLEKVGKSNLEDTLASLRSSLALAESERDRLKSQNEGLLSGTGKANELQGQLESQKTLTSRAMAQVELLNQQIAALRRQLGALESALEASESKDKESQSRIADLGQRLNLALAQRVQELSRFRSEFFGRLRTILGDRPDIRVVGDRFVFQSEVFFDPGQAVLQPGGRAELDKLKEAVAETGSNRAATAAMANLAEAIHGLVSHMRTEQQMIRDWADSQAAQGREVQRLLERIAGEEPRKDELRKTVR
jgi:chemotaxis protein MotB